MDTYLNNLEKLATSTNMEPVLVDIELLQWCERTIKSLTRQLQSANAMYELAKAFHDEKEAELRLAQYQRDKAEGALLKYTVAEQNNRLKIFPCSLGSVIYEIDKDCSKCNHFKEARYYEEDDGCRLSPLYFPNYRDENYNECCLQHLGLKKTEYNPNIHKDEQLGTTWFLHKADAEEGLRKFKNSQRTKFESGVEE